MLLQKVGVTPEHRDGWRCNLNLRGVQQLHFPAPGLWRLFARDELPEHVVHLCCRNAFQTLSLDLKNHVEHASDPLPRFR